MAGEHTGVTRSDAGKGTVTPSRMSVLAFAALLSIALSWAAFVFGGGGDLPLDSWRGYHDDFLELARAHPATTMLLVFVLHALLAALALPGASLLMVITGSAYGPLAGTLICLTACTLGATLTMLAARHLLRPVVTRKWGARLVGFDERIARDGPAYLFSLRLLPVIPFALVNVGAGLSAMKTSTFIAVSLAGMLAGTFVYVNAGAELANVHEFREMLNPRTLLALALLALLPWATRLMRRQPARGKAAPPPRTLVLFNHDWDRLGFSRWQRTFPADSAGFDLFSFPSNARLAGFDLQRFVDRLARAAPQRQWQAVTSHQEQFGALAAALLAERMGWPGTPVRAVLACQHKLHARRILQAVAPEANTQAALLESGYGEPIPEGIAYPVFVKPVKAAFSVLARCVRNRGELVAMTRFGAWELWVIRHLVEPFERVAAERLPEAGSAHRLMLETPAAGRQYNLDGYVFEGRLDALGFVESVMYPGTQSFMRFDYPCALPEAARERAIDVARRFLRAAGFTHGLFNMEFFHDVAHDRLTVIEFNPRMASQFSDLYRRVDGIDLHRIALELAHGRDPRLLPREQPVAGAAASFVYRSFDPAARPHSPGRSQQRDLARRFPDAMFFHFPKSAGQISRDFKWLGSFRYGILHLGGRDTHDLRERCAAASRLLGWPVPYPRPLDATEGGQAPPLPELSLETFQ